MTSPCLPPTPGPPPHDGQEHLRIEIWYLKRPTIRKVPRNGRALQCLAIFAETNRKHVMVAATVTTASNGLCSSMKASCTWASPCWRTRSNMRATMSLHSVAV
ncbi:peptide hydrolase [Trypanosoma cruzi]|nr:peptide hydrolase [Trypanosoma cruzi]